MKFLLKVVKKIKVPKRCEKFKRTENSAIVRLAKHGNSDGNHVVEYCRWGSTETAELKERNSAAWRSGEVAKGTQGAE